MITKEWSLIFFVCELFSYFCQLFENLIQYDLIIFTVLPPSHFKLTSTFPNHPIYALLPFLFFFFQSVETKLCCPYILWCVVFPWRMINTPGGGVKENWHSSQKLSTPKSFSAWDEARHPALLFMLESGLAWAGRGLCLLMSAGSSQVQQLCLLGDIHHLWLLGLFCTLICK